MSEFTSFDGVEIAYDDEGDGEPVLLLHGFAADADINWRRPGVIDALARNGRCVVSYDARGHGRSDKPHDPAAYSDNAMVKDASALLDHLEMGTVDIVGYSLGAVVALRLIASDARVRSAVLGGIGGQITPRESSRSRVADALESDGDDADSDPQVAQIRTFAESTGADLRALAAMQRAQMMMAPIDFSAITVPVLILVGDRDDLARQPEKLAARIPGSTVEVVPGNHLSAVDDPAFTQAIVRFLNAQAARTPDR